MESKRESECPLHGAGVRPDYLVGRRLEHVVASWHVYGSEAPSGPLDVWLIDSETVATRITTGSDWCLIVETSDPFAGYDMAESGRVEVEPISGEIPFADHLGETVLAVSEKSAPDSGRIAWEITFDSGRVRCETWCGDLRLSSK
ncbi:hypothetical protein [Streptomyces sp. WAC01280]|uniref:hypothetical protein n=1 Tax=Streptomyces sp. WAC01280 TaxID=2487424 RepID=UPI000F7B2BB6|nr:hypothetical protein [Streptomyces sp. WAC01280]RSS55493.1 hypothetical protein EF909_20325 [Streptomyces sp. WAC01280]